MKKSDSSIKMNDISNESSFSIESYKHPKSIYLDDPIKIYKKIENTLKNFCERKIKDNFNLKKYIDELRKSIQEIIEETLKKWESVISSIKKEIFEIKNILNLDSQNSSDYGSNNSFIQTTLLINSDIVEIKEEINHLINKNTDLNLSYILFDTNFLKAINFFNEFYKFKLPEYKALNLSYNNIRNIKGIERANFRNLETLDLSNNKLTDISYLVKTDFPKLKKLWLYNNNISDISPLKDIKYNDLEILSLNNNSIEDINIFVKVNFTKIIVLDLGNNFISDVSMLKNVKFEKLKILGLNNNKIEKIDFLENPNLSILKEIYLENNLIEDINIFGKLKLNKLNKLEILSLSNNRIKDISCLNDFKFISLKKIYLYHNNISKKNILNERVFNNVSVHLNDDD